MDYTNELGKKYRRRRKMLNRNAFVAIPAFVLVLGLVLSGCPNGTTDNAGDANSQKASNLQSFEGEFVASEQEATILASAADIQIQQAINAALTQGIQASMGAARAVVSQNGYYEYNGIRLDYTVTGNTTSTTFPFYYDVKELVSIDGTYSGYKIKGNYNLDIRYGFISQTVSSVKCDYDCWYAVSYNGKGMKVITTGEMNVDITSSGSDVSYDMHYAVYDNNNVRRYNYDDNYPAGN
jgi:hypothetical protein